MNFSMLSYIEDVADNEISENSAPYRHKVKEILLDADPDAMECFPSWGCRYAVSSKNALLMRPTPIFYQQFYLGVEGASAGMLNNSLTRNPYIKVGMEVNSEAKGNLIGSGNLPLREVNAKDFVALENLGGQSYAAINFKAMFKEAQNSWIHSVLSGENKTYTRLISGTDIYWLRAIVDFNDPQADRATVTSSAGLQGSVFISEKAVYIPANLNGVRSKMEPVVRLLPAAPTAAWFEVDNKTSHTLHYYLLQADGRRVERLKPIDQGLQGVKPLEQATLYVPSVGPWMANGRFTGRILAIENKLEKYLNANYGGDEDATAVALQRIIAAQGATGYVQVYEGASVRQLEGVLARGSRLTDLLGLDEAPQEPDNPSILELGVADAANAAYSASDASFAAAPGDVVELHLRNMPSRANFLGLTGPVWVVLRQLQGGACADFLGRVQAEGSCTVAAALTPDGGLRFVLPAFSGSGRFAVWAISERNSDNTPKTLVPRWDVARLVELAAAPSTPGTPTGTATDLLNDTGVTGFANDSQNNLATEPATHPRQDARYGRDAAAGTGQLVKVGGGSAGFDFTKIANDGSALPASAVLGNGPGDWACTRDNVTGLVWEIKATSGLRSQSHTYTWYDSNPTTNGGAAGAAPGSNCFASGRCDTEKYVQDVNATHLCGSGAWRMPTVKELEGIADLSRVNPSIDPAYFPNTPSSAVWSGSPDAGGSSGAWFVSFDVGGAGYVNRSLNFAVRLVCAGP